MCLSTSAFAVPVAAGAPARVGYRVALLRGHSAFQCAVPREASCSRHCKRADSRACAGAAAGDVIPEAELRALLRLVDLEYLLERPGGLRAVVDWAAQLSLGERPAHGLAPCIAVCSCVRRPVWQPGRPAHHLCGPALRRPLF